MHDHTDPTAPAYEGRVRSRLYAGRVPGRIYAVANQKGGVGKTTTAINLAACLAEALASGSDRYDYVFLDCPPSLGPLTVNALAAADRVLVPVQAEYYALEGLTQLLHSVELIRRRLNPRLGIGGLLLTMVDGRTRLAQQVEEEVRRHFGPLVFRTSVPRSVRLAEAPSHGLPAIAYDRRSAGADAYWKVAMELVERA